jgi:hypothetical protein
MVSFFSSIHFSVESPGLMGDMKDLIRQAHAFSALSLWKLPLQRLPKTTEMTRGNYGLASWFGPACLIYKTPMARKVTRYWIEIST